MFRLFVANVNKSIWPPPGRKIGVGCTMGALSNREIHVKNTMGGSTKWAVRCETTVDALIFLKKNMD